MKQEIDKYLSRVFTILELFIKNESSLSFNEIAELSGLNKMTCSRIISALVKHEYLEHKQKRGNYSLGPIFMLYSRAFGSKLYFRDVAVKYLSVLSRQTKELTAIGYPNGTEYVTETVIDESVDKHALKVSFDIHIQAPHYTTSLGKIILSNLSEKELQAYFNRTPPIQITPNTLTDVDAIIKHLADVRRQGFAIDDEESIKGLRSVAAGIKDVDDKLLASICLVAPSVRLTRARMNKTVIIVKKCADKISEEIQYIDLNHSMRA